MPLTDLKLLDSHINNQGVVAAPDKLVGNAQENKKLFDRLIREAFRGLYNNLIDVLSGSGGASEIGATEISGAEGTDVQSILISLKTLVDSKTDQSAAEIALALKSDKAVTNTHIKSVDFNPLTGVFTFTHENGTVDSFDTVLEKVAMNWTFDAASQSLVLTLADGETQTVPLGAFITENEFSGSGNIVFSVVGHVVSATIKAGCITDEMLSSTLAELLRSYVNAAAGSATAAAGSENRAENYAAAAAESAAAAARAKTGAEEAAVHAPDIRDGMWWVWQQGIGYVNTEEPATGPQGPTGYNAIDENTITEYSGVLFADGGAVAAKGFATAVSPESSDGQIPSAKAVYDLFTSIVNGNEVAY